MALDIEKDRHDHALAVGNDDLVEVAHAILVQLRPLISTVLPFVLAENGRLDSLVEFESQEKSIAPLFSATAGAVFLYNI